MLSTAGVNDWIAVLIPPETAYVDYWSVIKAEEALVEKTKLIVAIVANEIDLIDISFLFWVIYSPLQRYMVFD